MLMTSQSIYFPSYGYENTVFYEIPDSGRKFIVLLLSYQLNFVNQYKKSYYYRNAIALKNSLKVPSSSLLLPKFVPQIGSGYLTNEILFYAQSFAFLLSSHKFTISPYQAKILERAFNSFLWEIY